MTGLCSRATIAVMGALLLVALFACSDDTEPVRLATEGTYHPFNFINDDGEIDGLERELGDELCRRAELECQWVLNDWESMIPDLVAEEFDAIIAGMGSTYVAPRLRIASSIGSSHDKPASDGPSGRNRADNRLNHRSALVPTWQRH